MNAFEELINNRWIVKSREKEKYYRVKDAVAEFKTFAVEKLGYRIIVNPYMVKMEKLPGEPKAWMGIRDFADPADYSFLCITLMFLEDKEAEEQFVLSQLTEYIAGAFPHGMDWTIFANRRKLVRVIKFCLKNDLFLIDEGSEDEFSQNMETEALFENTGLSRYFMRNFGRDISGFTRPEDFFAGEWVDMDEERGLIRRQRVYRKLLLAPGVYKSGPADEDFAYIKNFRNLIESDLQQYTDCSLQVQRGSAYLIVGEQGELGDVLPANNSLTDGVLLLNGMIREKIGAEFMPDANEIIDVSQVELRRLAEECFVRYAGNFAKKHREMAKEDYTEELLDEMERLGIIEADGLTERVKIYPIAGKLRGEYRSEPEPAGGKGPEEES